MPKVDLNARQSGRGRSALGWAAFGLVLGVWWLMFAPAWMGGPATFVMVQGHSMEPMLHTGDAVVARRQTSYRVGDLVVIRVHGGHVIHRLVAQAPDGMWTTRGDNNSFDDPWRVSSADIAGSYWLLVPGMGAFFSWLVDSPMQFGLACASVGLLFCIPWCRRRYAPELSAALEVGIEEPRPAGRPMVEGGVLWVSGLGGLVSLTLIGVLTASRQLVSLQGLICGAALMWTGGSALYFAHRLHDGSGLAEPARSVHALSGRLWMVDELPVLDPPADSVRSAAALRGIAERYRMPVLHHVDAESGAHQFLLITVQRGAFVWRPAPEPFPDAHSTEIHSAAQA